MFRAQSQAAVDKAKQLVETLIDFNSEEGETMRQAQRRKGQILNGEHQMRDATRFALVDTTVAADPASPRTALRLGRSGLPRALWRCLLLCSAAPSLDAASRIRVVSYYPCLAISS